MSLFSKKEKKKGTSDCPITQVSKDDPSNTKALKKTEGSFTSKFINYFCKCLLPMKKQNASENLSTVSQQKITIQTQPSQKLLKKILVLDLDETLVHSSFQPVSDADFVLNIRVQGNPYTVYVRKRPGCEQFLDEMAKYYQVVIFTASLQEYADPLMDLIDKNRVAQLRLFREHCSVYKGAFIKDMNIFNYNLKNIILVDNSETSFLFQPENAVHIQAYFDDPKDRQLYRLMPVLAFLSKLPDVRRVDQNWKDFEDADESIKISPASPNSKSGKKSKAKYFDKLAFLQKLQNEYGEHYNFLQKYQNPCSSDQVIGSYDELDQPLTQRQDKDCDQYYQKDPALEEQDVNIQIKDEKESPQVLNDQNDSFQGQIIKQVEQPKKKSPKKPIKKPKLEIDIAAVEREQQKKLEQQEIDSFREKTQRSTRNLLGKSKEYEDFFMSPKQKEEELKKSICFEKENIEKEQKKAFDEIRFTVTKANLNSPVAKQKFIDFFEKNKRIIKKSQDI